MKKAFIVAATIASLFVMPGSVQAGEMNMKTAVEMAAQDELETKTMYAHGTFEIYAEPDTTSEVKGVAMENTSFDAAFTENGWTMILAEDGVAFIEAANLYEEPVNHNYFDHDLYLLAHLIAGEAQPCDDMEQRYVASVVLNRVADSRFPNSLEGVIFQKRQYACIPDGNFYRQPTERNWANARWILENGSILPGNVVWQSGGKQGRGVYLKTPWHYFCY